MRDRNATLFTEEGGQLTDLGISKIIYSGYVNDCVVKNSPVKLSFEDFDRGLDELAKTDEGVEQIKSAIVEWKNSTDIQNLIKDTEEKKSQIQPIEILPE